MPAPLLSAEAAEVAGRDPERAVPDMAAHLVGCREDHEVLRALLSGGPS